MSELFSILIWFQIVLSNSSYPFYFLQPLPTLSLPYTHTHTSESFEEADIAVLSYLSIFARSILSVPDVLTDVLEALISSTELSKIFCITLESSGIDKSKAQQSLFSMLVRLMIDKFDSVAYCTTGAWRRKLWLVGKDLDLHFPL